MRFHLLISAALGAATTSVLCAPRACLADGMGVLVQAQGDRLVVGYDDDSPGGQSIGARAFGSLLPSNGLTQDPSFLSLATPPAGAEALPVGAEVFWDFLPMTIGDATSNLFYWDGQGDADFAPAAAETLTLHDPDFNPATVDGAAAAVAGLRLGTTTASALSLHAHRWWWLQGADGAPTPGVYATALRLRADGYAPSEPIFVALSTFGVGSSALNDAALPWFEANADNLILQGDYNFDGRVGPEDYAVWRTQFNGGAPHSIEFGEADGNGDGVVDAADYTLWRDRLAAAPAVGSAATAAPEPSAAMALLAALGLATSAAGRGHHSIWAASNTGPSTQVRL